MAHINGVFSNAHAGRLTVTLTGTFTIGSQNRDAGFPVGDRNMMLRARVGGVAGPSIDKYAPVVSYELDYPGGSTVWPVATEFVASSGSGVQSYGFTSLQLVLRLTKK